MSCLPETVRTTPVHGGDRVLLVSTIRICRGRYDTVVFDESEDRANTGRSVGRWVIDKYNERTDDRESAMDAHRDAVYAARTEPLTHTPSTAA
jgi:hypothetical protein